MDYSKPRRTLVFLIEANCGSEELLGSKTVKTLREYADVLDGLGSETYKGSARSDEGPSEEAKKYLTKNFRTVGSQSIEEWEDSQGSLVMVVHGIDNFECLW